MLTIAIPGVLKNQKTPKVEKTPKESNLPLPQNPGESYVKSEAQPLEVSLKFKSPKNDRKGRLTNIAISTGAYLTHAAACLALGPGGALVAPAGMAVLALTKVAKNGGLKGLNGKQKMKLLLGVAGVVTLGAAALTLGTAPAMLLAKSSMTKVLGAGLTGATLGVLDSRFPWPKETGRKNIQEPPSNSPGTNGNSVSPGAENLYSNLTPGRLSMEAQKPL